MSSALAPANVRAERVGALRTRLPDMGADGLLVSHAPNIRYLSGFTLQPGEEKVAGYSGTLLITADRQVLLADFRYLEQAEAEARDWEIVRTTGPIHEDLPTLLDDAGVETLALEADSVSHATWVALDEAAPSVQLQPAGDVVGSLREVKSPDEVAAIERACRLGDRCFEFLLDAATPGMTERQLAWQLERWFRENGAECLAFDPGVLAGPKAAMPHGQYGDVPIEPGNVLLLDFGCQVDGYRSDMTRTVFVGQPTDEQRRIYDLVREAQRIAIEGIRPGMTGREADALARDFLAEHGYGSAFGHSLGHGIGLETHERPRLSTRSDSVLNEGMVFSVEPGIYLPGVTGVRIEDIVVLDSDGVRRLTSSTRDVVVIGSTGEAVG